MKKFFWWKLKSVWSSTVEESVVTFIFVYTNNVVLLTMYQRDAIFFPFIFKGLWLASPCFFLNESANTYLFQHVSMFPMFHLSHVFKNFLSFNFLFMNQNSLCNTKGHSLCCPFFWDFSLSGRTWRNQKFFNVLWSIYFQWPKPSDMLWFALLEEPFGDNYFCFILTTFVLLPIYFCDKKKTVPSVFHSPVKEFISDNFGNGDLMKTPKSWKDWIHAD